MRKNYKISLDQYTSMVVTAMAGLEMRLDYLLEQVEDFNISPQDLHRDLDEICALEDQQQEYTLILQELIKHSEIN